MNINKKALLEWLEQQPPQYKIIPTIQSGRFDSPEMEHEKEYWAREGLIKRQQEELERLRAAVTWYSSVDTYKPNKHGVRKIDVDCGNKARNALNGIMFENDARGETKC